MCCNPTGSLSYLLLIVVTQVFAFELPLPWRLVVALWGYLAVLVADRPRAGERGSPRRRLRTAGGGTRTLIRLWIWNDKSDSRFIISKMKNTQTILICHPSCHWCTDAVICALASLPKRTWSVEYFRCCFFVPASDSMLLPEPVALGLAILSAVTG